MENNCEICGGNEEVGHGDWCIVERQNQVINENLEKVENENEK